MKLWEINSSEIEGDAQSVMRLGTQYQISNGYMGYRGTLDEYRSEQQVGVTIAGLFDQVGDAWREPVNAPNGGYTSVEIDGSPVGVLTSEVASHRQRLDFHRAEFERETCFKLGTKRVTIRSKRFLSSVTPNLCVIRFSISCDQDAKVVVRTGIDGKIWDLNGPHLVDQVFSKNDDALLVNAWTQETGQQLTVAEALHCPFGKEVYEVEDQLNLRVIEWETQAGEVYSFDKYFAVVCEKDKLGESVPRTALAIAREACRQGYDRCLRDHQQEWAERWLRSDVVLEGDDDAQLALRYSILQLLMVAPVRGSGNSIPARALSGQVYKGAVFWDTEMFMYPFYLHTNPSVARDLLRYRIRTLEGARRKARSEGPGFRGAFYAWESQETGDDACSYFNVGDPVTGRELRTHFRDKQIHISGDVAIAFWRYFEHTGDDSLLLEGGAEVMLECARFYASYAYFKKDKNRYELLDVIGPDEYHERVNNNAFTNQVAKETFDIALKAVEHLRATYPEFLEELLSRLDIESELVEFAEVAKLLYVPRPDETTSLIEQFDGYWKLRDATLEEVKGQLVHPNEYWGAGQGVAVPTQIIKQADVVMMLTLFRDRYDAKVKEANWKYYEQRTEHGSSLSACAYALVALEFGECDFAYRYFLKTAKVDLEGNYKLYAGTIFIGGSHPAANGGAWMTAVFGFAGLQVTERGLSITPRLFKKWKRMQIPISYRGEQFVITITRREVIVSSSPKNRNTHRVLVAGREVTCSPGSSVLTEIQENALEGAC
ncbi:glycosyl hydrolase family 65 protein [Pelagicoccus sp. SDUM812003]|uniref:glycosyl hydrolase family 65 protein n=1 Tax=Pelagicoccus sp. SDUM812003 TaxID=3041267 RepID=UPI00280D9D9A|nr:glycosyl hydrolase family 65 protein [Pelagicoccus sp. SDUM812003]MDQ8204153.1 glycosyl hydrolase family 65 protein [Pelagicoccus sp. SDUM812003]